MPISSTVSNSNVVRAMLLGLVLLAGLFVWEGHQGFSLFDEGYLWYGVQRVLAGEVPIRDFQAYDPGRYYWSAGLMRLSGTHGIMAVRETIVILQAFALAAALGWLAAIDKKRSNFRYSIICALTLVAWMVPRHKIFDISISIGLVCVLASLVRRPSGRNHFLVGLTVGLAAYFGRNHGVYGALASSGVILYLALRCEGWTDWGHGVLIFAAGLLVGYLPMLATMVLARGFTSAFVDSIKFLFEVKATNLPLPIPWPWNAQFGAAPFVDVLREVLIGLFFISTLAFGCISIAYVLIARWNRKAIHPLVVACAFCAIPYAHYAFSRADPGHLAQGIFPTLIGILALVASTPMWTRYLVACGLCACSWLAMIPMHPGWQCMAPDACERISIDGDRLFVDRGAANDISLLRHLKDEYTPSGQNFFVAPLWPGAYALLDAKSPTWEIYTAWPRSNVFQREEIDRIKSSKSAFILIYDLPLDGRDELRYRNTHPLIEQYIRTNYTRVTGLTDNPAYQIYRSEGGT